MRDYKHVKVPRSYRTTNRRTVTRRVDTGRAGAGRTAGRTAGAMGTVLVVLLTAALCYGAWWGYDWLTHAAVFQIAGVDVQGARQVSEDEVRAIAALFTGQNIFRVDPASAAQKARSNPWVKDVLIERKLPNRVRMAFSERTPRAALRTEHGRYLLDDTGTVIVPADDGPEARTLPTIAIRDWKAVAGTPVTAEALPAALALLDALAARGGWDPGKVTVKADSPETIAILFAGKEFRVGSGNYDEKLRRLGEIVSDMNRQGIAYSAVELRPERQAAVLVAKRSKAEKREGKKGRR